MYFALISFGFAQPLFNTVVVFRREFHLGPADAALIVFAFQYMMAALAAALRALLPRPGLRRSLDFLVAAGAALMLIRQGQLVHMETGGFSAGGKFMLLAGMAVCACAAALVILRFLKPLVFYAGVISPVFGAVFMHAVITHDLPLRSGAPAADPSAAGPAAVLTVLDGLSMEILRGPGGGVDAENFPNFARLAARGVWWKNAAANHPVSKASFPSFLASKLSYSAVPGVAAFEDNAEALSGPNIFSVFQNAGYRVHVYSDHFGCAGRRFACASHLDAARPGFLLKTLALFIEKFGPEFMSHWIFPQLNGESLHTESGHLIKTLQTAAPGEFHLVHMMVTHWPYVLNTDGGYKFSRHWRFLPGSDFSAVLKNYREQVRYVDSVIGHALDAIDNRPADNPMILMMIADHGECWTKECPGLHDRRLTRMIESSMVSIPVMLLSPSAAPRVDEDDFQLIDVAPTLCEAAGLKGCENHGFDGVSRLHNPPPERLRRFFLRPDHAPVDIPLPARPVPAPPLPAG